MRNPVAVLCCSGIFFIISFIMRLIGVLLFCLLALCLPAMAATKYVAVLETVSNDSVPVALQERQFVTNVLRAEAVKSLPADSGYTIMTRENIVTMLPPDVSIEECEGSCLVETGRNIAADFVAQARIGLYAGKYTLTVELYDTKSGNLISSFTGRGEDSEGLLKIVEDNSPEFFKVCKPVVEKVEEPSPDAAQVVVSPASALANDSAALAATSADASKSIPANVKEHPWDDVRPTLIWVSASVLVVGVVGALFADYYAKDRYETSSPHSRDDYRMYKNDIRLCQNLRTVGIVMGVVGAAGLGFSIMF